MQVVFFFVCVVSRYLVERGSLSSISPWLELCWGGSICQTLRKEGVTRWREFGVIGAENSQRTKDI